MNKNDHYEHVQNNFGDRADAYLSSSVHAAGEDLAALSVLLDRHPGARVADLGCGAGHAAFAAAARTGFVTAYDLSQRMLDTVAREAAARGIGNLEIVRGAAENLPFADGSYDVVISRYSLHHWQDPAAAFREVFRVLKPGGSLYLVDVAAPGRAVADIWLQTVEALRDTSHVCDYAPGDLLRLMTEAGLTVGGLQKFRLHLAFDSWISRMQTPDVLVSAIRAYQQTAAEDIRRYFELAEDGSFSVDTVLVEAVRSV